MTFNGNGKFESKVFDYNTSNTYNTDLNQNIYRTYKIKDDSLIAIYGHIHGQCVDILTFKGKKKE